MDVEAEAACQRDPQLRLFYNSPEDEYESSLGERILTANARLRFDISVEIVHDTVSFLKVEGVTGLRRKGRYRFHL